MRIYFYFRDWVKNNEYFKDNVLSLTSYVTGSQLSRYKKKRRGIIRRKKVDEDELRAPFFKGNTIFNYTVIHNWIRI